MKPKIFISHSAHEAIDKRFMKRLLESLEKDFILFTDQENLKIGDNWRNEICSAICCSHAAIVLMTKEALNENEHSWVLIECSMLTLLKWAHNNYPIFVIRMNGVTIENIEKSAFKELKITDMQIGSSERIEEILEAIKSKCKGISDENEPLYHYQSRIANHLRQIKNADECLEFIIRDIDCCVDRRDPLRKEIHYRLARVLLVLKAELLIHYLMPILPTLKVEGSKILIDMLAPFWLDPTSIAFLENLVQKDQEIAKGQSTCSAKTEEFLRTAFGLNAQNDLIALMYIFRAGSLKEIPYDVIHLVLNDPENSIITLRKQIYAEMNRITGLNFNYNEPSLNKTIIKLALIKPIFIIIPRAATKGVVQRLREHFWPFIFVVLMGRDDPNGWNDIRNFEILRPLIGEIDEDDFLLKYANANRDAIAYIGNRCGNS
jgi:hypothetical protein